MCVLDVHVGHADVPTESPGDVPRRSLPPSLMSPGDGELVRTTAMNFAWMDGSLPPVTENSTREKVLLLLG